MPPLVQLLQGAQSPPVGGLKTKNKVNRKRREVIWEGGVDGLGS